MKYIFSGCKLLSDSIAEAVMSTIMKFLCWGIINQCDSMAEVVKPTFIKYCFLWWEIINNRNG